MRVLNSFNVFYVAWKLIWKNTMLSKNSKAI